MTLKSKAAPLGTTLRRPRKLVARLVLAELIAKRGRGPLERRRLVYTRRRA